MNRRVVVTGLGVVTSIGTGKEAFWSNLISGRSGISEVSGFDTKSHKRHYAGEIKDFDPGNYMNSRSIAFAGRAAQLGIAATRMAMQDAGIDREVIATANNTALILGTTMPEDGIIDYCSEHIISKKKRGIDRTHIANLFPHSIVHNISHFLGLKCEGLLLPNACGAGNFALGYAYDMIKSGRCGFGIAGGTESFSRIAFQGFQTLRAMAESKCSPFDKNRQGMLLGEGAGILILEEHDRAVARKADIYAELTGYGYSCDAHSMTIPKKEGVYKAMKKALDNSRAKPEEIDYISAHGTGTIANDKNECAAIKELFGHKYHDIPVSSIKSMLGHTMGAASAIEAVSCCLSIERGIIPPTINYDTPDPDCDINCVPNTALKRGVTMALNNGFAFGGNNCCVIFKKYN